MYGGVCLSEAVGSELRAEWPIVSVCLVAGEGSSKCLLLTRLIRGRPPLTASVPLSAQDTNILDRWRGIMEENHETLRGHGAEEAAAWGNKEKAEWWQRRADVDEAVGALLDELQQRWFADHGLVPLLVGKVVGEELEAALEGARNFAIELIVAARRLTRAGVRGKGSSRGKGGVRARGRERATASSLKTEDELASGVSDLIGACVHGGDVMSETSWLAIVRLALFEVSDAEAAAEEIAGKINARVLEAFAGVGVLRTENTGMCPDDDDISSLSDGAKTDKEDMCLSLDIEAGRSVRDSSGGMKRQIARPTAARATIDEVSLSKMKVVDLRRELSARGIAIAGLKLKPDLLARLTEAVRQKTDIAERVETKGRGRHGQRGVVTEQSHATSSGSLSQERVAAPARVINVSAKTSPPKARRVSAKANDDAGRIASADRSGGGSSAPEVGAQRHPVVLVLDEELQAMPWEALPCLRGRAVTRVPAVPFVFSALAARWERDVDSESTMAEADGGWVPSRDGVRLQHGFYVLDPEANLCHTRNHLGPVFEGLKERLGWSGVTGEAPTEETMVKALQEVDIFSYCGHGAGELLVGREAVAGLTRCAAAVLMGCSSGRLKGYGDFEPSGMVSSYLVGGSPAVVANLWDVTDRDIDRFNVALLESFVGRRREGEEGKRARSLTLAHAVAEARSECKMSFIIGHAPVCYGIPVAAARTPSSR